MATRAQLTWEGTIERTCSQPSDVGALPRSSSMSQGCPVKSTRQIVHDMCMNLKRVHSLKCERQGQDSMVHSNALLLSGFFKKVLLLFSPYLSYVFARFCDRMIMEMSEIRAKVVGMRTRGVKLRVRFSTKVLQEDRMICDRRISWIALQMQSTDLLVTKRQSSCTGFRCKWLDLYFCGSSNFFELWS